MALTKVKAGNILLTTPSASSNDVTPATTQYVTTAIGNLIDTAPSTLNTLNELAAALGDDVNFSTTVTNSIATKLPLAGGTLTGTLNITQASTADTIKLTRGTTSHNNMIKFVTGSSDKWIVGQRNDSTDHFRFYSYGTSSDVLSIQTDGNVGIDNTSPTNKLAIGTNLGSGYVITAASTSQYGMVLQTTESTPTNNAAFWVRSEDSNAVNTVFRVNNNGKVGIGTTDPANPLSISVQTHGLYSQHRPSNSNGVGQEMYYKFNTADGTPEIFSSIYSEIESNANGAESGKIALRAAKAGSLDTGLILIGSTGNVGIGGELNPSHALEVNGSTNYQGVHVRGNNTPSFTMAQGTSSTPSWRLGISGYDGNDLAISTGATVGDQMRMDPSGNVMFALGTSNIAPRQNLNSASASLQTKGPIVSGYSQGTFTSPARNIRDWFVYAGPTTNTGVYVHMKTDLDAGTQSNYQFTMSNFTYHNYYAYGGTFARGQIGWHNWSGTLYNVVRHNEGTLELVQPSYISSDGKCVLVARIDQSYAQFSIDWFQWGGYTFREAKVTAVTQHSAATGAY